MKKIGKLKLVNIEKENLETKELVLLKGGYTCNCACACAANCHCTGDPMSNSSSNSSFFGTGVSSGNSYSPAYTSSI